MSCMSPTAPRPPCRQPKPSAASGSRPRAPPSPPNWEWATAGADGPSSPVLGSLTQLLWPLWSNDCQGWLQLPEGHFISKGELCEMHGMECTFQPAMYNLSPCHVLLCPSCGLQSHPGHKIISWWTSLIHKCALCQKRHAVLISNYSSPSLYTIIASNKSSVIITANMECCQ